MTLARPPALLRWAGGGGEGERGRFLEGPGAPAPTPEAEAMGALDRRDSATGLERELLETAALEADSEKTSDYTGLKIVHEH